MKRSAPRRPASQGIASRLLPARYVTPTADYAIPKALKHGTSSLFFLLDRVGLHVMPKHFYTPVADYAWLRRNRSLWMGRAPMAQVEWDVDLQLGWLTKAVEAHVAEISDPDWFRNLEQYGFGPGFDAIDAMALYCIVRSERPKRIIEIGCGVSTAIMIEAERRNVTETGTPSQHLCIEPYPRDALRSIPEIQLDARMVQAVPTAVFDDLGDGDLLFIDSSHAVKTGSDVNHLFLNVIPRLRPGVLIHVHDVALPYVYNPAALVDYFGWQETALLLALLTGNSHLQPLLGMSALHYDRQAELKRLFPGYRPQGHREGLQDKGWLDAHLPTSFYMRTS